MQARACIRFVPTFHPYGSGGKGASLQLEAQHVNHVLPNVAAFLAYAPTAPWESDAGKSLHSLRTNLSLLRQRRKRSITAAGGTTCSIFPASVVKGLTTEVIVASYNGIV